MLIKGPKGLLDLSTPKVMGVVNVTPDSFYQGSRKNQIDELITTIGQMVEEGVDILDIGAMSSRPGAEEVFVEEEIGRLQILADVRVRFPDLWISLDTYRSEVLDACRQYDIDIVNDISAGSMDDTFLQTVGESGLPYVLMHMLGTPADMQRDPSYDDVVLDILKYMDQKISEVRQHGIKDVVLDLGFGFGKTLEQNYSLLRGMKSFHIFELPILVGVSRKSMIYKALDISPDEALNGTTALHMLALQQGAKILRVHDVRAAKEAIKLWQLYSGENNDI